MRRIGNIVIILILLLSGMNIACAQKRNTLIITDDHLVLQIDLKSPQKELDSIFKIAGISKVMGGKVLKGEFDGLNADGWNMASQEGSMVRFDRSLSDLNDNPQSKPYMITTRIPQIDGKPGYPEAVNYGVNKFAKITVFGLSSGLTRFILPGYERAKRVFLSGSFNNWSTLKGLMQKTDGGWVLDVKLNPGAYEYKYIIDGRWTTDPNNLQRVDDEAGNLNSAFYKYNYTFRLQGNTSAQRITITGDFNNWDGNELLMAKTGNEWLLQMYLIDGKHLYRFLVDGKPVTDPANPLKEKDVDGNISSVLNLGEKVNFKLAGYPKAQKVMLAGNFNRWNPDDIALKKTGDSWILPQPLTLVAGNYNYKFIVDGNWITDPLNPLYAVEDGVTNSFVPVKPNHIFKLKGHGDARDIKLIGTFSKWEKGEYTLAHKGDEWVIALYLKPGKYLYQFSIDGQRIRDPDDKLWEPGEDDSGNSVLWIE
ncbi:MAG TPA: hypothetical protein VNX40_14615 [Mucilaginibacter sp.]|nr:hypothetical protein [Mucilaginibacter sp.]